MAGCNFSVLDRGSTAGFGCDAFCQQCIPSWDSGKVLGDWGMLCWGDISGEGGSEIPGSSAAHCDFSACPPLPLALCSICTPSTMVLPLTSAGGASGDPSAVLVSCSLFNGFNKFLMSLQGFTLLMVVSWPVEATERICWPACSHVFTSRGAPSDTSNPWLSYHTIRATKACLLYFSHLFFKTSVHSCRRESSSAEDCAPGTWVPGIVSNPQRGV